MILGKQDSQAPPLHQMYGIKGWLDIDQLFSWQKDIGKATEGYTGCAFLWSQGKALIVISDSKNACSAFVALEICF